jgi:hypothetical protein
MSSFDVGNISLNIKRKLEREGLDGIEVDSSKRPKMSSFVSASPLFYSHALHYEEWIGCMGLVSCAGICHGGGR